MLKTDSPRPLDYWLLWLVAIAALALNLYLINTLLQVRAQAGVAAAQAAAAVGEIREAEINYTFEVNQVIPVNVSVPISRTITIPISNTVPISTIVSIPLEIPGFGTRTITLPIRAELPIRLQQTIPVSLTVPINAKVPVNLEVPISIAVVDTPFGPQLSEGEAVLNALAAELGAVEP
ncbi:MAG TPA: hypothetical protein PLC98_22005 [Anaerolineales bacterium]|nr:hypothetical protein [Anaerolineales bacterium]